MKKKMKSATTDPQQSELEPRTLAQEFKSWVYIRLSYLQLDESRWKENTKIRTSTELNLHVYWTPLAIVLTHRQRQYSFQIFWHLKNKWQCLSTLVLAGFLSAFCFSRAWYNLLLSNTTGWKERYFSSRWFASKSKSSAASLSLSPWTKPPIIWIYTSHMSRCLCRLCSVFLYNSNFWDRQRESSLITFICSLYLHQLVEPTDPHPTSTLHSHYTSSLQCWRLPLRYVFNFDVCSEFPWAAMDFFWQKQCFFSFCQLLHGGHRSSRSCTDLCPSLS